MGLTGIVHNLYPLQDLILVRRLIAGTLLAFCLAACGSSKPAQSPNREAQEPWRKARELAKANQDRPAIAEYEIAINLDPNTVQMKTEAGMLLMSHRAYYGAEGYFADAPIEKA